MSREEWELIQGALKADLSRRASELDRTLALVAAIDRDVQQRARVEQSTKQSNQLLAMVSARCHHRIFGLI
jgi:hypothetical protein